DRFERSVMAAGVSDSVKQAGRRACEQARQMLGDFEAVRGELFTAESTDALLAQADGLTQSAISALHAHCRRQFSDPDGGQLSKADRAQVKAVDGSDLDEDDFYMTIDVED